MKKDSINETANIGKLFEALGLVVLVLVCRF